METRFGATHTFGALAAAAPLTISVNSDNNDRNRAIICQPFVIRIVTRLIVPTPARLRTLASRFDLQVRSRRQDFRGNADD
jgi:hypothetical protein